MNMDMENTQGNIAPQDLSKFVFYLCDLCEWYFMALEQNDLSSCPYCHEPSLVQIPQEGRDSLYSIERFMPFTVTNQQLDSGVANFLDGIPFRPNDLTIENIYSRMQRIFLPMWLVDSDVKAIWQAEVGFDYQVVSHQDRYDQNRGGWRSKETQETRIRWEPRLGKLNRKYDNVIAPALEHEKSLSDRIGTYDWTDAREYTSESIQDVSIRLPDREQDDAWQSAVPTFHALASDECRKAAKADHIRQYSWKPDFLNHHWTLLLRPIYSSYYLNDDKGIQRVLINGQSGKVYGKRFASLKRAQRTSWIILAVALGVFLLGVALAGLSFIAPPLLAVGALGLAVSLAIALGAIYPIVTVWWFNRQLTNQDK